MILGGPGALGSSGWRALAPLPMAPSSELSTLQACRSALGAARRELDVSGRAAAQGPDSFAAQGLDGCIFWFVCGTHKQ